jgi:hypothetical protein
VTWPSTNPTCQQVHYKIPLSDLFLYPCTLYGELEWDCILLARQPQESWCWTWKVQWRTERAGGCWDGWARANGRSCRVISINIVYSYKWQCSLTTQKIDILIERQWEHLHQHQIAMITGIPQNSLTHSVNKHWWTSPPSPSLSHWPGLNMVIDNTGYAIWQYFALPHWFLQEWHRNPVESTGMAPFLQESKGIYSNRFWRQELNKNSFK